MTTPYERAVPISNPYFPHTQLALLSPLHSPCDTLYLYILSVFPSLEGKFPKGGQGPIYFFTVETQPPGTVSAI